MWKWENNYHPDNPEFRQVVYWRAWKNNTGRITVTYSLGTTGAGKVHQYIDVETNMAEYMAAMTAPSGAEREGK